MIDVTNTNQLPRRFEAYPASMTVDQIVEHFLQKHGYEPDALYRLVVKKMSLVAAKIDKEE
jgi:hypothetical protein